MVTAQQRSPHSHNHYSASLGPLPGALQRHSNGLLNGLLDSRVLRVAVAVSTCFGSTHESQSPPLRIYTLFSLALPVLFFIPKLLIFDWCVRPPVLLFELANLCTFCTCACKYYPSPSHPRDSAIVRCRRRRIQLIAAIPNLIKTNPTTAQKPLSSTDTLLFRTLSCLFAYWSNTFGPGSPDTNLPHLTVDLPPAAQLGFRHSLLSCTLLKIFWPEAQDAHPRPQQDSDHHSCSCSTPHRRRSSHPPRRLFRLWTWQWHKMEYLFSTSTRPVHH